MAFRMLLVLSVAVVNVRSFNIDVNVPIVKHGTAHSYFGFSVALHRINGSENVILVGAPRDNSTSADTPGNVYRCPVTSQINDCEILPLDWTAILDDPKMHIENQWMGVSVTSNTKLPKGKAVICAHRQYEHGEKTYNWGKGFCQAISNHLSTDYESLDEMFGPCDSIKSDIFQGGNFDHQQCQCQAGTSATIGPDGEVLIGAPGSLSGRGTLHARRKATNDLDDITRDRHSIYTDGRSGLPTPITAMFSYLGMSVKMGKIIDGADKTYVGSAPSGAHAMGQVFMFEPEGIEDLKVRHVLSGDRSASGYGTDIAIGDFNKDGKDDLVVGAPFYYERDVLRGLYLGGAIYIYLSVPNGIGVTSATHPLLVRIQTSKTVHCEDKQRCIDARFGFAVANAGDLDRDGCTDFVVGAPREGHGAIYIYRGSADKHKLVVYSQRISASDVRGTPTLSMFGHSLQNNVEAEDIDGNTYPDLVVGAYSSDTVVVLRSRPVIVVKATLTSEPSGINATLTRCVDGQPFNCFKVAVCFKFSAEPKKRFQSTLAIKFRLYADTASRIGRVFFSATNQDISFIERDVTIKPQNTSSDTCFHEMVYIRKSIRDMLNSVLFNLSYSLPDKRPPTMNPDQSLADLTDYPVISPSSESPKLTVPFQKNCGSDDICSSNLVLTLSVPNLKPDTENIYILDNDEPLVLNIQVVNRGEDAHDTSVNVTFPDYISFDGSDTKAKQFGCTGDNDNVFCSIGNPMSAQNVAQFQLHFRATTTSRVEAEIVVAVNTTSAEHDTNNDVQVVKIRIRVETDLALLGSSDPETVVYNGETYQATGAPKSQHEIGPVVKHIYEVKNIGRVTMPQCRLNIHWPSRLSSNPQSFLLYLVQPPEVDDQGLVTCTDDFSVIDPLNLPEIINSESRSNRKKRSTNYELACDGGRMECTKFVCTVSSLGPGKSAVVTFHSRLWNRTVVDEDLNLPDRFLLSSTARLEFDANVGVDQPNTDNDVLKVSVVVMDAARTEAPPVDWWIILVAILIGLLLFTLLIILLWKLNFFKRHRIQQHQADKVEPKSSDMRDSSAD